SSSNGGTRVCKRQTYESAEPRLVAPRVSSTDMLPQVQLNLPTLSFYRIYFNRSRAARHGLPGLGLPRRFLFASEFATTHRNISRSGSVPNVLPVLHFQIIIGHSGYIIAHHPV